MGWLSLEDQSSVRISRSLKKAQKSAASPGCANCFASSKAASGSKEAYSTPSSSDCTWYPYISATAIVSPTLRDSSDKIPRRISRLRNRISMASWSYSGSSPPGMWVETNCGYPDSRMIRAASGQLSSSPISTKSP